MKGVTLCFPRPGPFIKRELADVCKLQMPAGERKPGSSGLAPDSVTAPTAPFPELHLISSPPPTSSSSRSVPGGILVRAVLWLPNTYRFAVGKQLLLQLLLLLLLLQQKQQQQQPWKRASKLWKSHICQRKKTLLTKTNVRTKLPLTANL